eukprot:gene7996-5556_t
MPPPTHTFRGAFAQLKRMPFRRCAGRVGLTRCLCFGLNGVRFLALPPALQLAYVSTQEHRVGSGSDDHDGAQTNIRDTLSSANNILVHPLPQTAHKRIGIHALEKKCGETPSFGLAGLSFAFDFYFHHTILTTHSAKEGETHSLHGIDRDCFFSPDYRLRLASDSDGGFRVPFTSAYKNQKCKATETDTEITDVSNVCVLLFTPSEAHGILFLLSLLLLLFRFLFFCPFFFHSPLSSIETPSLSSTRLHCVASLIPRTFLLRGLTPQHIISITPRRIQTEVWLTHTMLSRLLQERQQRQERVAAAPSLSPAVHRIRRELQKFIAEDDPPLDPAAARDVSPSGAAAGATQRWVGLRGLPAGTSLEMDTRNPYEVLVTFDAGTTPEQPWAGRPLTFRLVFTERFPYEGPRVRFVGPFRLFHPNIECGAGTDGYDRRTPSAGAEEGRPGAEGEQRSPDAPDPRTAAQCAEDAAVAESSGGWGVCLGIQLDWRPTFTLTDLLLSLWVLLEHPNLDDPLPGMSRVAAEMMKADPKRYAAVARQWAMGHYVL